MKHILIPFLLILSIINCSHFKTLKNAKDTYPYIVKIKDFYSAAGFTHDYYITDDKIIVVYSDDIGIQPKEVFNRKLKQNELEKWQSYIKNFNTIHLHAEYINSIISDGIQMTFHFNFNNNEKNIILENVYQKELAELCETVNVFLPNKYKIRDLNYIKTF